MLLASYQQKLRNALFQTATVLFAGCGLIAFLRTVLWFAWSNAIQAIAFGVGTIILLGCLRALHSPALHNVAKSMGILCVLTVLWVLNTTADPGLFLIGVIAVAFVLLFCSLVESRSSAWFWCMVSIGMHLGVLLLRQFTVTLHLNYTVELLAPIYLFPPAAFVFVTRLGIVLAKQFQSTLVLNEQLQQDLSERHEEFQRLLQTMNEGFIIADENEVFTYVNDKACEIFGYTRAELVNRRNEEVLIYDAASLEILRQQTAIRTQNQRSTYELCSQRKDGTPLQFRVSAMPKFDKQGVFRGAICVITDITERKQAEEALQVERTLLNQRIEERTASLQAATAALQQELAERKQVEIALRAAEQDYRTLFDNVPIGLYRSSLDGRQLRANPALVALNGYASEAEMVTSVKDIATEWYVDPKRRAEFQQLLAEQGYITNFESEIYRYKSRERIWITESALLVTDKQGVPLYYQGTVQDITKRKQIEQEQEHLIAQLAKSARLKDEFLANMSHELRTPLNSILGMAEALSDEIYGDLTPRQRKALGTIDASGRHLLSLINDILDLAKVESGQIELNYSTVDVDALCQSTVRLIQATAEKKKLTVTVDLDPAVKLITADGRRVKQILLNLLSNAVKFTPEQGAITLQVIGVTGDDAFVRFVVSDTGVGIRQDAMENLFKPFVQLDSSLSRQYDGTGLGLALVYRMVELHNGTVTVTSEVGKGSCFTVTLPWDKMYCPANSSPKALPVAAQTTATRTLVTATLPGTATLTNPPVWPLETIVPHPVDHVAPSPLILLAEDNPIAMQAVTDFLRYKGYQVETATNGIQAITKAHSLQPALILMDMQMPDMDGLEATRRLRADTRLSTIPVIAFTALAMPSDQARCSAAGVDAYLSKPVSLYHLQTTIEQFLPHMSESIEQ